MKRPFISVATVAVAAVASGGLLTGLAGNAHATTPPPWEPDSSSVGGLTFYDASGDQITGGSASDSPIAAYVKGTTTVRAGDTKATLYGYLPVSGQTPPQWTGTQLSASTTYPNGDAPGSLATATLPVVTGASGDESAAQLATDLPNTDVTSDGYSGLYQLRLVTSGSGESASTTYDSADIEISGGTWSVVYSQAPALPTTTTLEVSPAGPVFHGAKVTLTATVAPTAAAGSVQFLDGTTVIKTVVVSAGTATSSTTKLKDATHKLSAKFVPATTAYATSTSTKHSLVVKAHPTKVTLKASKSKLKKGKPLTLTIKESPAAAGKVVIFDGSKKLGTVTLKKGKAKFHTTKLKVGKHHLKATFKPASKADDAPSSSKKVTVTITA